MAEGAFNNVTEGGAIGVDCGGTNCRVAYRDATRQVDYIGAGANFTTTPEGCAAAIIAAVERLADKAGLSAAQLFEAPAYLGVAGIVTDDQAARLRDALPFADALVEDDRPAAVKGALAGADGYVAAIGTGSFFARQFDGSITSIGGHGLLLGDEASGAWLGRSLLEMALQAHDGMLDNTALTQAVLDEFGGPSAIVEFASDATPAEYARLAPGLAGAAEAGDPQGRLMMQTGADWLARALTVLGWQAGAPIVLPGKLGPLYTGYLPEEMQNSVADPEGTSLDGALSLAEARVPEPA